ncbi:T9SS type A sorting domain-containing protein [Flavobacterium sp. MAH-1]|uniref:T9SS type A sorting domain-containing protein n=1 Tax=Flavobacterium agri TaxID=2743471 RepID=A0A7Y8XZ02_9FLAO|nr:T9SS type A sorting domain-containing protein [Flavobacterium agri]NUY79297.1 T9SS type A sorting domain-containing protein [Flavobacterium agri]NYA69321.1 T9SS type A sorting domain-containing protein [Flavobacterium agri]
MNKNYSFFTLLALFFSAVSMGQVTVAQWNFNGPSNTTVPGDSFSPMSSTSLTSATAFLVGNTTATFANGNTSAGTFETETTSPPNYAWNTSTYPAQGTANKTAGTQFNVSTAGYQGITLRFDQRLSNKAGNTYVVQYTTNVNVAIPTWVDAQTFTFTPGASGTTGDVWYTNRTVSLSSVTALDNNPNAAFRIVGAFDPTTNTYLSATAASTYDGLGTVRFDVVTVIAQTALSVNQPQIQTFSMSPNPTRHGIVQLSQPQTVTVFDLLGKAVYKAKETTTIDTRSFKTGVYIVKTESGISRKLIVE